MSLLSRLSKGVGLFLLGTLAGQIACAAPAERVVSVGGSVTEIVYALGEGHRLVARDSTSSYPAEAEALPNIGYARALSPEGVLSVSPDLIIASAGAGPVETLDVLKQADIAYAEVPEVYSPAGVITKIETVAAALGAEDKAKALLAEAGVDGMELTVGVREAQERLEIGQSLQNTFAQAGITLNLEVGTGKQVLGKYRARELDIYLGAWGPDYPDPHTNAGTFAYNPDNSDEANATGLLAWRNTWDTAGLTEKTAAAVVEGDTEKRAEMYHEIQAEFRDKSPFAVMFQKVEQAGVAENVEGLSLGGAITAVSYWSVTK